MLSLDEAIEHAREVAKEQKKDNEQCKYKPEYGCEGCADYYAKPCVECAEEHEQLAEWLEKLKYIENIILRWNADWYNDEDTGIPDNEILEAIFNACNDNGFDIPIDEDFRKGYNKAIDDLKKEWDSRVKELISWCKDGRLIGLQQANSIFDEIADQLRDRN